MNTFSVLSSRAAVAAAFLAVLAMAAVTGPASADPNSGVYAIASGDGTARANAAEDTSTYTAFQNGDAVNFAVGYQFKSLGVDYEYTHAINWTKTVAAAITGPQPGLGNVSLNFNLFNLRYEFPAMGHLKPYAAIGAGEYLSNINDLSNIVVAKYGYFVNSTNDRQTFAYQGRLGLEFAVASQAKLLVGYRFLRGGNLVFPNTAFGTLTPNGATINAIEVGMKFGH